MSPNQDTLRQSELCFAASLNEEGSSMTEWWNEEAMLAGKNTQQIGWVDLLKSDTLSIIANSLQQEEDTGASLVVQ